MSFVSFSWLAWMIAGISLYWILPLRFRDYSFAAFSIIFLILVDWLSALLLVSLTVATYSMAARKWKRFGVGRIVGPAILVVAVLAFYKIRVSNEPLDVIREVSVPLGLSYYSFRLVHYLIERYRNALPKHTFGDFICYLFFLPTLVVGPIHRFGPFVQDRSTKTWSAENLSMGMERILIGYFKVVVLGNFLMSKYMAIRIGELDASLQPLIFYLEAVRGSLNLYFQFSGYSDIAIGFSLLLGYRVMENFDWPFLKSNLIEFWRSWHISLTSWSREYIYMTTLGATRNPILATLAALLFIGIWHELSLRYVAWGLYHGFGIIAVSQWRKMMRKHGIKPIRNPVLQPISNGVKIFLTANYFFLGYIIIHQPSLSNALRAYWIVLFSWWL